ncbi:phospholipid-transporting ATPase ABCA3 [Halyomorpha halys]|uniref:phospholipid-transporting ATPase ABCA3 n=1 Tax=Halyomorpha halys TaxID=286706 RepID=UPI0006D51DD1|nr:ATP-binding cassette sub-family A member 1-like [Halyomorpha halys]XP_024216711.1 ATP-binding cassette sub-family A member 1-like [Halyomorpha halys]
MFCALIYKSWCISKRKYFSTLLSIIWPNIILLAIIFTKESQDHGDLPSMIQSEFRPAPSGKEHFLNDLPNLNLAYTPQNEFTNRIMSKLSIKNNVTLVPFHTTSDVEQWFLLSENQHVQCFGIIFNSPDNITKPPPNFSYTIRWMNNYVPTDSLFPEVEKLGGPLEAGKTYIYSGFFGLKTSLDDAFLKEIGSGEVNWTAQEFPYPPHEIPILPEENLSGKMYPLILIVCFISLWTSAASLSAEERMSGIIERMKMFGMSDFYVVLNYLLHSTLRQFFSTFLFTILLITPMKGPALLEKSSFILVWIILLLVCVHSTTHCLAVSSFFNNAIFRQLVVTSTFTYFSLWILNGFIKASFSGITLIFGDLFAPFCLVHISLISSQLKSNGGITFSEIFSSGATDSDLPLIVVFLLMITGSVLNMLLYIYMLNVKPGPYGSAKPFYFILPNKCLSLFKVSPMNSNNDENETNLRRGLYESVPDRVEVGIKIVNLRKKFGHFTSVKNFSLDVYVGQITVLLGHNGAGKTTTLSMLSGMLSPSSGSAVYRGYNIFTDLKTFRKDLGLCPQHNLLHLDLSVIQQLIFFGMLKGLSKKEANEQAVVILKEVGLSEKRDEVSSNLSGGMQRKLCIALAMTGKPKVVILDEPTSGLDPESRREIWNILLKSRGERMMLITTHFMEEADALGDQIAIMNHGEICCYGTPLFLKKQYGAGYHVTISHRNPEKSKSIIQTVNSSISETVIINQSEEWIKFGIPFTRVTEFPVLFKLLESREDLEISRVGINCTTMEDVYLKVQEEAGDARSMSNGMMDENDEGIASMTGNIYMLYIERFLGLVNKNMNRTLKRWFPALLILVFVPVLTAYFAMDPLENFVLGKNDTTNLTLSLNIYGPTEVFVFGKNNTRMRNAFLSIVQKEGSSYVDMTSQNEGNTLLKELLEVAVEDKNKYFKSMITAADFSDSVPNFLYSSVANHAPIVALDLLYNTILQSDSHTSNYTIKTSSHPITTSLGICGNDEIGLITSTAAWIGTLPLGLFIVCSCFIKHVHEERVSSLKHLILMTNISPVSYWASFIIWDIALYILSISLIMITFVITDTAEILYLDNGLYLLFLVFFLFGLSMIWLTYFLTFFFKTSLGATSVYYSVIFILGWIGFAVVSLCPAEYKSYANFLKLHPLTSLAEAMVKFITTAILKFKCQSCLPDVTANMNCPEILKSSYFSELKNSLTFLGTAWILYSLLIILKDYGIFSLVWNKLNSLYLGHIEASNLRSVESDVAKEKDKVDASLSLTDEDGAPIVIVDSIAKKYSRSMIAVYDVSFTCKEGECFGLLGVNGAGKTTTFSILSGMIPPTQGNAFIKSYSLEQNKQKCLSYMGYCPQFSALIDDLTAKQMLTLFAKLRLVPSHYVDTIVMKWIHLLGLEEYSDICCGVYSGGNMRKLSTALAFIGNPPIILLDEPSSGVDPMIRRNLWDVIKGSSNRKQAIIISSHSMDECEEVCNRLTIMAKGRMQCIGNVQHLKSLYGQGYIIMIKLKNHSEEQREALKIEMKHIFLSKCILKDEHQVLLHYHIDTNVYKVSELFSSMESLKNRFIIIDDYIITDSSLEQVFLSFAKKQSF